jgi:predicted glycosyltransferase involved in capsule biosynthesis
MDDDLFELVTDFEAIEIEDAKTFLDPFFSSSHLSHLPSDKLESKAKTYLIGAQKRAKKSFSDMVFFCLVSKLLSNRNFSKPFGMREPQKAKIDTIGITLNF